MHPRLTTHQHLIRATLAGLALAVALCPGLVWAQVPKTPAEITNQSLGLLLVLASVCLVGVVIVAMILLLRMRRQRMEIHAPQGQAFARRQRMQTHANLQPTRRRGLSQQTTSPDGESSATPETEFGVALKASVQESAEDFLQWNSSLRSDRLDTTVGSMQCATCQSIYHLGAQFCPDDGTELHEVEVDASMLANLEDHTLVCPTCDERFRGEGAFCPNDGTRMMLDEDNTHLYIPMPVLFCTERHREISSGMGLSTQTTVPVMGRRSCGEPISGVGPKRKMCPQCGTRYPLEANFCALDQEKLVNIN